MADQHGWEEARKLKDGGKLIPFIGSGLSTHLGIPPSDRLVDIIASELGWDPEILRMSGDLPQIAEYYVSIKRGIGTLRSRLDKEFFRKNEQIRSSRCHMAIVENNFPVIYTTNYDDLIERAFEIQGVRHRVISHLADFSEVSSGETQIVKFHGTFSDDSSLVLTESSYFERLEFDSALDIRLRSDILGKVLLFIGYSFRDLDVRYLIYKLHKLTQKQGVVDGQLPIAIMTTFSADEVQQTLWKLRNVSIIELAPLDPSKSLAEFLEYLK